MALKRIFGIKNILKFSAGIIAFFMGILTVCVVILGAIQGSKAILKLLKFLKTGDKNLHAGIEILDTLDVFLVAIVFLIFTVGIVQLFIKHDNDDYLAAVPDWLIINNLSDLKFLLMQTIIATLFIYCISMLAEADEHATLEWLVVPGVILMLSISLAVLMLAEHKAHPKGKPSKKDVRDGRLSQRNEEEHS